MLNHLNPVSAAGSVVSSVAGAVDRFASKAVSTFAQTLDETPPPAIKRAIDSRSSEATIESLQQTLSDWFEQSPFAENAPAELELQSDGDIRITSDHPLAAALEDAIQSDQTLQAELREILANGQLQTPQRLVLTPDQKPANIASSDPASVLDRKPSRPGGYANW